MRELGGIGGFWGLDKGFPEWELAVEVHERFPNWEENLGLVTKLEGVRRTWDLWTQVSVQNRDANLGHPPAM